jgi:hypothetical protein
MATNEYIGAKRRMYTTADRKKRIRILDEVCETTGYERKYANRLLTGSRKFRERKGRGKTYGEEAGWNSTGESASDCERYVVFRMLTPWTSTQGRIFLPSRPVPPWRFAPPLRGRLDFTAKGQTIVKPTNA